VKCFQCHDNFVVDSDGHACSDAETYGHTFGGCRILDTELYAVGQHKCQECLPEFYQLHPDNSRCYKNHNQNLLHGCREFREMDPHSGVLGYEEKDSISTPRCYENRVFDKYSQMCVVNHYLRDLNSMPHKILQDSWYDLEIVWNREVDYTGQFIGGPTRFIDDTVDFRGCLYLNKDTGQCVMCMKGTLLCDGTCGNFEAFIDKIKWGNFQRAIQPDCKKHSPSKLLELKTFCDENCESCDENGCLTKKNYLSAPDQTCEISVVSINLQKELGTCYKCREGYT
jgi:hypothetical protein